MFGKLKEIIGLGEYDEEFDELEETERGAGGFGSSGV